MNEPKPIKRVYYLCFRDFVYEAQESNSYVKDEEEQKRDKACFFFDFREYFLFEEGYYINIEDYTDHPYPEHQCSNEKRDDLNPAYIFDNLQQVEEKLHEMLQEFYQRQILNMKEAYKDAKKSIKQKIKHAKICYGEFEDGEDYDLEDCAGPYWSPETVKVYCKGKK